MALYDKMMYTYNRTCETYFVDDYEIFGTSLLPTSPRHLKVGLREVDPKTQSFDGILEPLSSLSFRSKRSAMSKTMANVVI